MLLLASVRNLSFDEINSCIVHTSQKTALMIRLNTVLAQYILVSFHDRSTDSKDSELGIWLGRSAQPQKPPDLEGASAWCYKDAANGASGCRGGLLSSCSPEAITSQPSNGDSGAVGFSTLFLQLPCPRARQTASFPQTVPLTSSADLIIPFHIS